MALERKLEVMTAALNQQTRHGPHHNPGSTIPVAGAKGVLGLNRNGGKRLDGKYRTSPPTANHPVQRRHDSGGGPAYPTEIPISKAEPAQASPPAQAPQQPAPAQPEIGTKAKLVHLWSIMRQNAAAQLKDIDLGVRMKKVRYDNDVVARGVIDLQEAELRLELFRNKFQREFPLIELPDEMDVESMRRETPLLFMTIMSVTSQGIEGKERRSACVSLYNQTTDCIMYESMALGSKTLELLKCAILLTMWNNTPEIYHHQKIHFLTQLCIMLAIDLGLAGQAGDVQSRPRFEQIARPYLLPDPCTYECRRLWLSVYISSINVALVVKRPVLMIWSKYTEECCTMLEGPDRPQSEHRLAAFARLYHLHEEIVTALHVMPRGLPDVNDPRTRCVVRYFEHRLQALARSVDLASVPQCTTVYLIQIHLHESVMYASATPRFGRVPFSEYGLATGSLAATPHTRKALEWCYTSAVKALEEIAGIPLGTLAVMPMALFTRLAFCTSTLLKLRTLHLTNPSFSLLCAVDVAGILGLVGSVVSRLELVMAQFPFANMAVNFCFVLHVLVSHFERLVSIYGDGEDTLEQDQGPKSVASQQPPSQSQQRQQPPQQVPSFFDGLHSFKTSAENRPSKTQPSLLMDPPTTLSTFNQPPSTTTASATNSTLPTTTTAQHNSYQPYSLHAPIDHRRHSYSGLQPGSPLDILSAVAMGDHSIATNTGSGSNGGGSRRVSGEEYGIMNRFETQPRHASDPSSGGSGGNGSGTFHLPLSNSSSVTGLDVSNVSEPAQASAPAHAPFQPELAPNGQFDLESQVQEDTHLVEGQQADGLPDEEEGGLGDYPEWLSTDYFWKDLVPGIEALSGFDLYGM